MVPAEPVAETKPRGGDWSLRSEDREMRVRQRGPVQMIMNDVIRKCRELVEDHVLRIAFQLRTFVVYFLDVALGPGVRMMSSGRATHYPANRIARELMPAGSTATPRQPRMRDTATPPRQ